jgi:hypothetical protein
MVPRGREECGGIGSGDVAQVYSMYYLVMGQCLFYAPVINSCSTGPVSQRSDDLLSLRPMLPFIDIYGNKT